jgi:acetyl esterase/lipase
VAARPPHAPAVRYGAHPDQVANLHLPAEEGGPWPVVVLLHGGFWRDRWDRTLMTPLAHDLARRGLLAWNVEYRRVGRDGGGWPGTLDDAGAAVDALAGVPEADTGRVVAVGHSAGGQLALWLAAREAPGVRLAAAVSLAGVCDLERAHAEGLGDGAVAAFLGLGEPGVDASERIRAASPAAAPARVPQLLVHGDADDVVPLAQSRAYATRAREAGAEVELVELAGADHFDVVDPAHEAWRVVVERLPALLAILAP